jgi:CRISPR-associated protein Cas2
MDMSRRALTSTRGTYLCTYDVSDDKRRTRLFNLLKDHGEHVQYSVFLRELSPMERTALARRGQEFLNHEQDQLLIIRVGPSGLDWTAHLDCVGKHWTPETRSTII